MSKFDKFLNFFKINGDEEDYEDYEEDYDEVDYKKNKYSNSKQDLDETYEEDDESEYEEEAATTSSPKQFQRRNNSKVVPMQSHNTYHNSNACLEVCVVKPSNVEEAKEITETLLQGKAVVLNLEGLHVDLAQRITDFSSGSCYAIQGKLQKISSYIFIITPSSVDISGDIPDILNNGNIDVSTL